MGKAIKSSRRFTSEKSARDFAKTTKGLVKDLRNIGINTAQKLGRAYIV